jgi:hypothetical protein
MVRRVHKAAAAVAVDSKESIFDQARDNNFFRYNIVLYY